MKVKNENESVDQDLENLRARLRTRQTEFSVSEEKIEEILADRESTT